MISLEIYIFLSVKTILIFTNYLYLKHPVFCKMVEENYRVTNEILQKSVAVELSVPSEEVKIIQFDVSAGADIGDNFVTIVKLVQFKYKLKGDEQEKEHSYVFKQIPFNEFREKFVRNVSLAFATHPRQIILHSLKDQFVYKYYHL